MDSTKLITGTIVEMMEDYLTVAVAPFTGLPVTLPVGTQLRVFTNIDGTIETYKLGENTLFSIPLALVRVISHLDS